jgi:hypothetical protein
VTFGCAEVEDDVGADHNAALATINGLSTINGLTCSNGLSATNGLSVINGLSTINGLASTYGLMTTASGRNQVAYIVRCALPETESITKTDQYGNSYTFPGLIGLAPQWQTGACDLNCQEVVSACLMAHVNTSGVHVPLWIVAQNTAVGWGQNVEFPNQEGAFFGNVFTLGAHGTDPKKAPAYYCTGSKYNVNPPQGRIGSTQTNPPYVNPFGSTYASCATNYNCATADYPSQADGFKACYGWNNVVTVWRQNATTTLTTTTPPGGKGHGYHVK